jgi:hypothetical protein
MAQPLVVKKDDDLDEEGEYAGASPSLAPPRAAYSCELLSMFARARAQICARRALDLSRFARDRRRVCCHRPSIDLLTAWLLVGAAEYYSPFLGIEKGAVLQEARVFHDPQLDARRCCQVPASSQRRFIYASIWGSREPRVNAL